MSTAPMSPSSRPTEAPTGMSSGASPSTTATPQPRLTRSRDDRMIAGVAGGIAEHLGIDPALVRIAFVLITLAAGAGVLAYLIAWLVIPEAPPTDSAPTHAAPDAPTLRLAAGALLVLVGLSWLLNQFVPGIGRAAWPATLIVLGVLVITAGARR